MTPEGRMKNFVYHRPTSVKTALPLLSDKWGPAELLGGGTDLLDRTKDYVSGPDAVVSLTGIGGAFRQIDPAFPPGNFPPSVTIGAGVRLAEIAENKDLKSSYPALSTAAGMI